MVEVLQYELKGAGGGGKTFVRGVMALGWAAAAPNAGHDHDHEAASAVAEPAAVDPVATTSVAVRAL